MSILRKPLTIAALLMTACQQTATPTDSSALTREQFVDLYVALYAARDSTRTAAAFEAARRQIFERAGVPQESLTRFAAEHGGEVAYMAAVWDSIKNRLDLASEAIPK